jgi:hypothetical protein
VGVGLYPAVKTLLPLHHPHKGQVPVFPETFDVPVYRAQGKPGEAGFKLLIDPAGAGMGLGRPEDPKNLIPFPAVAFPGVLLHKTIIITVIVKVKENPGPAYLLYFSNFVYY